MPDRCFYVQAGGRDYNMLTDRISSINVMEGHDQDDPDQNYWNFHDVSITN
jgi:hypothetical protein